jgi:hypothetical protein
MVRVLSEIAARASDAERKPALRLAGGYVAAIVVRVRALIELKPRGLATEPLFAARAVTLRLCNL